MLHFKKKVLLLLTCCLLFVSMSFATDIEDLLDTSSSIWPYPRIFNPDPSLTNSSEIRDKIIDELFTGTGQAGWVSGAENFDSDIIDGLNNYIPIMKSHNDIADEYVYKQAIKAYFTNKDYHWDKVVQALKIANVTGLNFHKDATKEIDGSSPYSTISQFPYDLCHNGTNYDFSQDRVDIIDLLNIYISSVNNYLGTYSELAAFFHKLGTFRGSDLMNMCKAYDLLRGSDYYGTLSSTDKEEMINNIQRFASELFCITLLETGQMKYVTGDGLLLYPENYRERNVGAHYTDVALILAGIVLGDQPPVTDPNGGTSYLVSYCTNPKKWFRQGLGNLRMGFYANDLDPDYHFFQAEVHKGYPSLFNEEGIGGSGQNYGRLLIQKAFIAYRAVSTFLSYVDPGENSLIRFTYRPELTRGVYLSDYENISDITGIDTNLDPNPWLNKIIDYYNFTQFPTGQVATFEDCRSTDVFVEKMFLRADNRRSALLIETYDKYDNTSSGRFSLLKDRICDDWFVYGCLNTQGNISVYASDNYQHDTAIPSLASLYDKRISHTGTYNEDISSPKSIVTYRSTWDSESNLYISLSGDHGENNTWENWHHTDNNNILYGQGEQWSRMNIHHERDDNMSFIVMKDTVHIYRNPGYPIWCRNSPMSFANSANTVEWLTTPNGTGPYSKGTPLTLEHPDPIGIAPLPRTNVDIKSQELDKNEVHSSAMQTSGYYYNNADNDARLERTIIAMGRNINGIDHSNLMINWDEIDVTQSTNIDNFVYNLTLNQIFKDSTGIYVQENSNNQYYASIAFKARHNSGINTNKTQGVKLLAKSNVAGYLNSQCNYAKASTDSVNCGDGYFNIDQDDIDSFLMLAPNYRHLRYKIRRPNVLSPRELNFNVVHGFSEDQEYSPIFDNWKATGIRLGMGESGDTLEGLRGATSVSFRTDMDILLQSKEWFAGRSIIFREYDENELNEDFEGDNGFEILECGRLIDFGGLDDNDSDPHNCYRSRRVASNLKAIVAYHYMVEVSTDTWEERVRFVYKEQIGRENHRPKPAILIYDFNNDGLLEANEKVYLQFREQNGEIRMVDFKYDNSDGQTESERIESGYHFQSNCTLSGEIHFEGTAYIDNGVTVAIAPGTKILLDGSANNSPRLYVYGKLTAVGTEEEPIEFEGVYPDNEGWIHFGSTADVESSMEYCSFTNLYRGIYFVDFEESTRNFNFKNLTFTDCYHGIDLLRSAVSMNLCDFYSCTYSVKTCQSDIYSFNCNIYDPIKHGYWIIDPSSTPTWPYEVYLYNINIDNSNSTQNTDDDGFNISGISNLYAKFININGVKDDGISLYSTSGTIYGSYIHNCEGNGLYFNASNPTIDRVTSERNGEHGIYCYADGVPILNKYNAIRNNYSHQIETTSATYPDLSSGYNNIYSGDFSNSEMLINGSYAPTTTLIMRNNYWGNISSIPLTTLFSHPANLDIVPYATAEFYFYLPATTITGGSGSQLLLEKNQAETVDPKALELKKFNTPAELSIANSTIQYNPLLMAIEEKTHGNVQSAKDQLAHIIDNTIDEAEKIAALVHWTFIGESNPETWAQKENKLRSWKNKAKPGSSFNRSLDDCIARCLVGQAKHEKAIKIFSDRFHSATTLLDSCEAESHIIYTYLDWASSLEDKDGNGLSNDSETLYKWDDLEIQLESISAVHNTDDLKPFNYTSANIRLEKLSKLDRSCSVVSEAVIPTEFKLANPYPNPFNPDVAIPFDVPNQSDVNIAIYNILGQKVKTLVNRPMQAGVHKVVWHGKNNDEMQVSSGVYFVKMEATNFVQSRKIVLLK